MSLELPTGSGKTLVGLLIGEFRRRIRKEKVVYCCLTKQLVNQVCEASNRQYGIAAIPFIGSKQEFSRKDKALYEAGDCIAVTTYSAIFNSNPYFRDADLLIFDDAHSAENFVAAPWTLEIEASQDPTLFESLIKAIRPSLTDEEFNRAFEGNNKASLTSLISLVPLVSINDQFNKIRMLLDNYFRNNPENNGCFAWGNIKNNLQGCLMYVSANALQIRPLIFPTKQFDPFTYPAQRLFMSGTFGERGELERSFGLTDITALPMLEEWTGRTTGRRLFMFPRFTSENMKEIDIYKKIMERDGRYLVVVSNNNMRSRFAEIVEEIGKIPFSASELEETKEVFTTCPNGVAVLANRLDGLDFPNDECRMEIIVQIPRATNMHEEFLFESAHARELYSERIRNRVTQAIGRCTRNQTDYAVVYILDENVEKTLASPRIRPLLNCELQAEIEFGLVNAKDQKTLDEYLKLAAVFLDDRDKWEQAEQHIQNNRKKKANQLKDNDNTASVLKSVASQEAACSLAMWNGHLDDAITEANKIVNTLRGIEHLEGYFSYWCYILYHLTCANNKEASANEEKGPTYILDEARNATPYNAWIVNRGTAIKNEVMENPSVLLRMKNKLKKAISKQGFQKLLDELDDLLIRLKGDEGISFENAHKELGEWLGYESYNFQESGAPDPIWKIDGCDCIVAEDKIYESNDKPIPLRDVDEAKRHENWVRNDERLHLNYDAKVVTVFISNSNRIGATAKINAEGIWWIEKDVFVNWASEAILAIKSYIARGINPKDDPEFEKTMSRELVDAGANSSAFLELVQRKKLKNLKEVKS